MKVIDRIFEYLNYRHQTPYNFEKTCGIANGYLKKQTKGKGSVGSEILEKISRQYKDLSLIWVLTGKGEMIIDPYAETDPRSAQLAEGEKAYSASEHLIQQLREKIAILESSLADKEKIIRLLESQSAG